LGVISYIFNRKYVQVIFL